MQFENHHKAGRTQLDNIHDIENLVGICKICHFAFDQKKWNFFPTDIATWLNDIKSEPEDDHIQRFNSLRNIEYRRWRLQNDPDSEASQDEYFNAAFTNEPT